jgi:hypothetical protein
VDRFHPLAVPPQSLGVLLVLVRGADREHGDPVPVFREVFDEIEGARPQ